MKNNAVYWLLLTSFILLFSGCSNPFFDIHVTQESNEMGRVTIDDIDYSNRTIFPSAPVFVSYNIDFEYLDEADMQQERLILSSLPHSLELFPGQWTVSVTAYTRIEDIEGIEDGDYIAATGSITVNVIPGINTPVVVDLLSGKENDEKGILEYDIGLPEEGLGGAVLRVLNMDRSEVEIINLLENSSGSFALNSGFYLLQVHVATGRSRTKTEIIHIYNWHTTHIKGSGWNFNTETGVYLTTIELSEFLASVPQNTADNPYPVKLNVDLSSLVSTPVTRNESLGRIFQALNGKYVALDLSDATGVINDLDHDSSASSLSPDRNKLVSVILPEGLTHLGHGAFAFCTSLKSVVLPSSLKSIGGNTSGSGTFRECSSLKDINLPPSLLSIGNNTFRDCTSLEQVILPFSLQNIGSVAFYNCSSLENVNFPSSLRNIGNQAFSFSAIKTADFSACNSIENFGGSVFSYCENLETVILPANLDVIPVQIFSNCTSLKTVNIPDSATEIGAYAFRHCTSLLNINIPAAVESIGTEAFLRCDNLTITIAANSRLETIQAGALAFGNQKSLDLSGLRFLRSIDLGRNLRDEIYESYSSLETLNLSGCISLQTINLSNLPALENADLSGCTNITSVSAINLSALEHINLTGCTSLTGANINFSGSTALTKVILRPNIGNIPASAFTGCTSMNTLYFVGSQTSVSLNLSALTWLKKIDLSACTALTVLGNGAFTSNTFIETVILPASLTTINGNTFQGWTSLKTLPVMPGIQSISSSAFQGCTSLYYDAETDTACLDLSGYTNLVSIGDNAFMNCTQLTSFILPVSIQNIGNAFPGCVKLRTGLTSLDLSSYVSLKIIDGTFARFINLASVVLPVGLENIGNNSFVSCAALLSINFPKTLKTIGDYAFGSSNNAETNWQTVRCSSLTTVDLSDCSSLQSIGNYAFNSCTALTTVNLSGCTSLQSIGSYAFASCTALTTVNLSGCTSLQTIGDYTFNSCTNLITADLSECSNLNSIGSFAFRNTKITTVNLSGNTSLINISNSAFSGCPSLETVDLSGASSLQSIGNFAFTNNPSLIKVDLSGASSLQSLGTGVFGDNPSLAIVDLSDCISLQSIGIRAFASCPSLSTLDLSDNNALTSIGGHAFFECSSLISIDLSSNTVLDFIGNFAFENCSELLFIDLGILSIPPELDLLRQTPIIKLDDTGHFIGTHNDFVIYVPYNSLDTYRTADIWSEYAAQIQAKP